MPSCGWTSCMEANKCVMDLAKGNIATTDQSVSLIANPSNPHTACSKVTILQKCIVLLCSKLEIEACLDSKEAGIWLIEGTP